MAYAAAVPLDSLSFDERDFVKVLDEASHVDIETSPRATRPTVSLLRSIVVNGRRYHDRGAACACASMRLFTFGDVAYTVCHDHGLQEIGPLRRDYPTNNHHARRSA